LQDNDSHDPKLGNEKMLVHRYAVRNCIWSAKIVTADRIPTTGRISKLSSHHRVPNRLRGPVREYR